MNLIFLGALLALCAVLMFIERSGVPTTLELSFRGDIKRESQWLAQYGQAVCTAAAAALIWQFDPAHQKQIVAVIVAVCTASISAFAFKRVCGRMRPKRENAGKFLGPSWRHDNARESFPSSHSACAVALTVSLIHLYPQAAGLFWTFALITAGLRYVLDAHWPSDVVGGIALGYACGSLIMRAFGA